MFSPKIRLLRWNVLMHKGVECRSFFASSTDHTRLMANAEVHCLEHLSVKGKQYVLVAEGMDLEMVKKVPQLHLARLFLDHDVMFGAKVVNRTLGDPVDVCGRLVDSARHDGAKQARCTLHGLSDFVLKTSSPDERIVALANGKQLDYSNDDDVRDQWDSYARDFIASQQCLEGNLYIDKGGMLVDILHQQDESEFANTCGKAMALFEFD